MYTSALWANYTQAVMRQLKVAYNNIMRRLAYVPPWQSASHMFGSLGVRSFGESIRNSAYGLMQRVEQCPNDLMRKLVRSDVAFVSIQRTRWHSILVR